MYYRLSQDIKILFLTFFQRLFALQKEGKISFTDGRNRIMFAQAPRCMELDTYDKKYYPCVLVGLSPASFRDVNPSKFRAVVNNDAGEPQNIYGFISSLTVNFNVVSLTKEDRNNLVDLVCMYLAKYETKAAFINQYGIRLGMPTFSGDNVEDDVQTNVKRFWTTITMPMEVDLEDNADIVDSMGRKGLTVQNIISLIGDTNSDGEIDVSGWTFQ